MRWLVSELLLLSVGPDNLYITKILKEHGLALAKSIFSITHGYFSFRGRGAKLHFATYVKNWAEAWVSGTVFLLYFRSVLMPIIADCCLVAHVWIHFWEYLNPSSLIRIILNKIGWNKTETYWNLSVRISGSEESLKENLLSVYPAALETWKVLHSESVQKWALHAFGASGLLHNRSKQVNMRWRRMWWSVQFKWMASFSSSLSTLPSVASLLWSIKEKTHPEE